MKRKSHAAPPHASTPRTTDADPRLANVVTAAMASGPSALPESDRRRQPARNFVRPLVGDASEPSVMTTPDEMPLPRPRRQATAMIVAVSYTHLRAHETPE